MIPDQFDPAAERELEDGIAYYEAAHPGLGARFREAVERAIETLRTWPQIAAVYPRSRCRQYGVSGYPYSLIYADRTDLIYIVAVAHHKRRPGYWKSRQPRS